MNRATRSCPVSKNPKAPARELGTIVAEITETSAPIMIAHGLCESHASVKATCAELNAMTAPRPSRAVDVSSRRLMKGNSVRALLGVEAAS